MPKPSSREPETTSPNVLPVLNVMFLLIPALLLAMEVASLAAIRVSPPQYGPEFGPPHPTPVARLDYFVHVTDSGFDTKANVDRTQTGEGNTHIPRRPDASFDYDFAQLEAQAHALKANYPATTTVTVSADAHIPLQVLVSTMDALRGTNCRVANIDSDHDTCLFWHPVIQASGWRQTT